MTAIAVNNSQSPDAQAIERVLLQGDLSQLTPEQRLHYYQSVCASLKLNPLTKPFEFLELKDRQTGGKKIVLYARKDCTEQLRRRDNISVEIVKRETIEDVFLVTARATIYVEQVESDGELNEIRFRARNDESIGAVGLKGMNAEDRANAMMKAETKAKRRVTLSICGLGFLDETEIENIPGAKMIEGEVK